MLEKEKRRHLEQYTRFMGLRKLASRSNKTMQRWRFYSEPLLESQSDECPCLLARPYLVVHLTGEINWHQLGCSSPTGYLDQYKHFACLKVHG